MKITNGRHNYSAILWILLFAGALSACISPRNTADVEVVNIMIKFYDTTSHEYILSTIYWPVQKVWFKDSFAIEEVVGIYMKEDEHGNELRKDSISYYTFIDLRKRSFYRYLNFSDTAAIVRKYKGPDPNTVDGVWNFYIDHGKFYEDKDSQPIDTIVAGTLYKRVKGYRIYQDETDTLQVQRTGYLRCDKKGTNFQLTKAQKGSIDCPLVRADDLTTPMLQGLHSNQIEFLSHKLSPEEWKVFKAWKKNAKDHPVGDNR